MIENLSNHGFSVFWRRSEKSFFNTFYFLAQNMWHSGHCRRNIVYYKKLENLVNRKWMGESKMKQVINALKRRDAEQRIPVLRLEIDYELAVLYEAMGMSNQEAIDLCKEHLEELRTEMLRLEA